MRGLLRPHGVALLAFAALAAPAGANATIPTGGARPSATGLEAATPDLPARDDARGPSKVPRAERPTGAQDAQRACSFREAVCVHAALATPERAIAATLTQAEHAFSGLRALGFSPLRTDDERGGGPQVDLYLTSTEHAFSDADLTARGDALDGDTGFGLLPARRAGWDCEAASDVTRVVADIWLTGIDAAMSDGERALASGYLAHLLAPCPRLEAEAVDTFQRSPEQPLTAGSRDALHASFLFPAYLDEVWGTGRPARIVEALAKVARQRSPIEGATYRNEPDMFDALRITLREQDKNLGDMLLDFAVDRAFMGARSDGMHLSDVSYLGDFGRVRFDWSVPYDSLPRRLTPMRPISSTGMTYLWLDLTNAPLDAEITLAFDWELPTLFRWAIVKVDAAGHEVARTTVPGLFGATHVEQTMRNVGGLAGLLLVGLNQGDIDRLNTFDPDDAPFEPHAYEVTLYR